MEVSLTQNLTSCSLFPLVLSCPPTHSHTDSEEKEEVTMDTSENRPENEVPEPPMPIADQVSNDDRPEGNAEDEEKKEVNIQATYWGGWVAQKVKILPANAGDAGSIPALGRSLGEGNGNPLQCSCLENPVDREAWWAIVQEEIIPPSLSTTGEKPT